MITMSLVEAADAMGGRISSTPDSFRGVSIDSRTITRQQLFFAIDGPRFDGHDYLVEVADKGACAAVVAEAKCSQAVLDSSSIPLIPVPDPRPALGKLANAWRRRFTASVAAITGSNGKTTVKELLFSILSQSDSTTKTEGNLNNDLGVPLTLCRVDASDRFAVLEMGTNHPGEIANLASIGEPDVGVVTNCGPAHLEGLGDIDGVIREKSSLYRGLRDHGIAAINIDLEYADRLRHAASGRQIIEYSSQRHADIYGENARDGDDRIGTIFDLCSNDQRHSVTLTLPGRHNMINALSAASLAYALEIPLEQIAAGLNKAHAVGGRSELVSGIHDSVIVDDSYNANPGSLDAGLAYLSGRPETKWLVLGDMGELGPSAKTFHKDVARRARHFGVVRLFTYGALAREAALAFGANAHACDELDQLIDEIETALGKEAAPVCLLVKGSRVNKLERVVSALKTESVAC